MEKAKLEKALTNLKATINRSVYYAVDIAHDSNKTSNQKGLIDSIKEGLGFMRVFENLIDMEGKESFSSEDGEFLAARRDALLGILGYLVEAERAYREIKATEQRRTMMSYGYPTEILENFAGIKEMIERLKQRIEQTTAILDEENTPKEELAREISLAASELREELKNLEFKLRSVTWPTFGFSKEPVVKLPRGSSKLEKIV